MSDTAANPPLHVTVDADVRISERSRAAGSSDEQLAQLLEGLIRRHAWEAGLDVPDPASVQVRVTPVSPA